MPVSLRIYSRSGVALIEMMVVIVVFGVFAAILLVALKPMENLTAANDAKRTSDAREIKNALYRYSIDAGILPQEIPVGESNAKPICGYQIISDPTCINVDFLVDQNYLYELPRDSAEENLNYTGYKLFSQSTGQLATLSAHMGVAAVN